MKENFAYMFESTLVMISYDEYLIHTKGASNASRSIRILMFRSKYQVRELFKGELLLEGLADLVLAAF